jgi:sulfide:quinone oxidoreductase
MAAPPSSTATSPLHVVIAGGGVAALEAMLALRALAAEHVEVELLAPEPDFWYRPLAVAEPFGLGRAHRFELAALTAAAGAHFSLDGLAAVDCERRIVRTAHGAQISYDALLLAVGARPVPEVEGAFTFRGPADTEGFARLLDDAENGLIRHLAFAVPGGTSWPLPLYELALLTASYLAARESEVKLTFVTPEPAPLAIFGPEGSEAITRLLSERGVDLHTGRYAVGLNHGRLELIPQLELEADCVVSLPRLTGPAIPGVPCDVEGFVPADETGAVHGVESVYAAGDATSFPIKQGGLASQQADTAARTIAARAGADVAPMPFRAVLRGLLLTGGIPQFLRADLARWGQGAFQQDVDPLWWPPSKISGRYLAPFLAERAGFLSVSGPPPHGIPVEVDLSARLDLAEPVPLSLKD